jgi:hypothetical protein
MPNKKLNVLNDLDEDPGWVEPDEDEGTGQDPDEGEIVWELARS